MEGRFQTILPEKQGQNQRETNPMPSTKEERAQRDPTLLNGRDWPQTK